MSRRTLLVVSFVTVSIVWGSTYFAIRLALEGGYPPFFVGAGRFIVAGLVLGVIARLRGEAMPTLREWGASALTGALFFVVGNGLVNVAERSVSSGLASVLCATMPVWATLFGRMFGGRSTPRELVGVGLGALGVVVLNLGGDLRASSIYAIVGLVAPMGWALGSITSQRLKLPKGLMRTAAQMLCGGVAMTAVSAVLGERVSSPTPTATLALVYLAVFGSLVGFTAYSYLLAHTRPAVATSYAYVNPVIAVLLGLLFAHEHFGAESAAGALIVLAAVALVQKRAPRAPASIPEEGGATSRPLSPPAPRAPA